MNILYIISIIYAIIIIGLSILGSLIFKNNLMKLYKQHTQKIPLTTFHSKLLDHDIPVVEVTVRDHVFNFLIDSGCNTNILDYATFFPNKNPPINATTSEIFSITMPPQQTTTATLTFSINGNEFTEVFEALDTTQGFAPIEQLYNQPIHGILGCDFFKKHNLILNFKDKLIEK